MHAISSSFAFGQIDQKVDMPDVSLAQETVAEHRAKRWRNRHRDLERHAIVHQLLHQLQKWNVTFRDRLEEPLFLQKMFVLGMSNKRQMRVQNQCERTRHRFRVQKPGTRAFSET